ncbi:hypothetical protein [Clostridium oryzae]|uniref:Lipoprotein n=1 Tax=Clostridium oryzae TaxID=1450648 RepID=A0A1V4IG54_9CLOT|nr:hypothetical protein [Clostridium oryzae]OPJ58507.1 hypothetical protein CLORY_35740 [Clostridium oryzae]
MKKRIIAAAILISVFLSSCGSGKANKNNINKTSSVKTETTVQDNSKYVSMVKEGEPDKYKGETYGEYFDKYFENPSWIHKSKDGNDYVQFSGNCTYRNTNVTAKILFLIDTEINTFTLDKMTFNDVPQDQLTIDELMTKVFGKQISPNNSGAENKTQDSNNSKKDSSSNKTDKSADNKTENVNTSKDSASKGNSSGNKSTGNVDNDRIDKERAVQLVKDYLKRKNEYMPKVIEVDSEDDKNFNVHCYDVVDSGKSSEHTATSGWYYVDKKTGKVTSMF